MRFLTPSSLLFSSILCSLSYLYSTSNNTPTSLPKPETFNADRCTLRHIEGKGVGYTQGYTTFEGFFIPTSFKDSYFPFVDLRAHIFNDGKIAANGGVGLRYVSDTIFGANLYYDYRKTAALTYNQFAGGIEFLGKNMDARLNAYFPMGAHTNTKTTLSFDQFQGNSLYIKREEEGGMRGFNAEVGFHLNNFYKNKPRPLRLYLSLGPYYFVSKFASTLGGSLLFSINFNDVFGIDVSTSYDHLFKWIGQGQVSISYPFKPKRFDKKASTSETPYLKNILIQKVYRNEIIVVDKKTTKEIAKNPETGQPYYFIFLDPKKQSAEALVVEAGKENGTFESPFSSWESAYNSLIEAKASPQASSMLFSLVPSSSLPQIERKTDLEISTSSDLLASHPEIVPSQTLTSSPSFALNPENFSLSLASSNKTPVVVDIASIKPSFTQLEFPLSAVKTASGNTETAYALPTNLGMVMIPASKTGTPTLKLLKKIECNGEVTNVFVITIEEEKSSTP